MQTSYRDVGLDPCITSFYAADEQWQPLTKHLDGHGPCRRRSMPSTPMAERVCDVMHNLHDRPHNLFDNINQRQYNSSRPDRRTARHTRACSSSTARPPTSTTPRPTRQSGLDLRRMMGEYNDFEGDDNYDDEILTPWPPPTNPHRNRPPRGRVRPTLP